VGQTTIGEWFVIPRNSQAITFHVPSLGGASAKLQALDPLGSDDPGTEVWRDVKVFNLAAGGVQALAAIPENTAVTLPTAATGAGVFRLVASADLSGSPVTITVLISRLN
jgi:hypothetical protein